MEIKDAHVVRVVAFPPLAAFLEGKHHYSFRCGERGAITAIVLVTISSDRVEVVNRPCFEVVYADGELDYVPIIDAHNYNIWFD